MNTKRNTRPPLNENKCRAMFTVVAEIQRKRTVKHKTLMPYSNVLHVSVHKNDRQESSLMKNEGA